MNSPAQNRIEGIATAQSAVPDAARLAEARSRLNRSSRLRSRPSGFLGLLPVLAVAVPALVLVLAGRQSWDEVVWDTTTELTRLADAAAETADRALGGYSVAAARINDRLLDLAAAAPADLRREAHELLADLVAELRPPVLAVAIDADGRPLAASHMFPIPADLDLRDRDFFQALASDNAPTVHISRMFEGRFDGQLLIAVSRARRSGGDTPSRGRFEGLTTISFDPNTLGESLRRLLPDQSDGLILLRGDGSPIASSVAHTEPLAPPERDPAFDAWLRSGAHAGSYRAEGRGGDDRLVAVRRLASFPAVAVATRPLSAMRARWRSVFLPYVAFGLPAIAGLLALSLRVRRDQLRLMEANAVLQRDVERSEERLERAKRYALVGTFEVDLTTGRSVRSPEYMAVHGLPPQSTSETHADWLRRLHPEDRAIVEARLLHAIADDNPATDYAQTYRTVTPSGEIRWISALGEIERDGTGRAVTLRGIHVDVTSLRSTEVALAETDARLLLAQDAVGIGAWEWSPTSGIFYLAPRTQELLGLSPAEPVRHWRRVVRRILPEDRVLLWRALRDAATSQALRVELRVSTGNDGALPSQAWLMIRARAIDLGDGKGTRLLGVAYDITDRKLAEARATMLAHEVEHRARNAMTLVSGLVRMTRADSHEQFVEILEGRIKSLAQTITLLGRSRWSGASIEDLVREELVPFSARPGQAPREIHIAGPRVIVDVDAAQQLSMALHELTTNSAKYGALSVPAGTVAVHWSINDGTVALSWKERGGPTLDAPPARDGFGSFLVRTAFEQQLGGTVAMAWERDGLRCSVTFPLRRDVPTEPGEAAA